MQISCGLFTLRLIRQALCKPADIVISIAVKDRK